MIFSVFRKALGPKWYKVSVKANNNENMDNPRSTIFGSNVRSLFDSQFLNIYTNTN